MTLNGCAVGGLRRRDLRLRAAASGASWSRGAVAGRPAERLHFGALRGGDEIYVIDVDGSNMKRLAGWCDGWLWAILALGLGLRLIWLDQPLIDQQAWRQTDTAAIARNFYEEGFNILYPRVDWRGTTPGYVEMNFPLFSFLVACVYSFTGVQEWVGRLLAALFSTAGAGLLYWLAWRLCGDWWTARLSALLYLLFPLSVFFGRAFMPEGLLLLLSVGALLTFERWTAVGGWSRYLLAGATAGLCFLVKIPTLYLGFPLVALAWARWGWGFLRRPALWGYLAVVLLPTFLWHLHAYRLFEQTGLTFGIWNRHGYDKWASELLYEPDFYLTMLRRFGHSIFTPLGLGLVAGGLFRGDGDRRRWMVPAWMGGLALYFFLIPEGNFRLHYYQLPFIPPGALAAGALLGRLLRADAGRDGWLRWLIGRSPRQRAGLVLLLFLGLGGYGAWAVQDYYRPPNNVYKYYQDCYAAGRVLDRKFPPDALLVVGDIDENPRGPFRAQSPTLLYYCHRKGWQIKPEEFSGTVLDSLAALGADYFLAGGGFVRPNRLFWQELLRRGITIPAEYPQWWTDEQLFDQMWKQHHEPERHFILAPLAGK